MRFALGILFMWLGAACLWIAFHDTNAKTPWEAFGEVANAVKSS